MASDADGRQFEDLIAELAMQDASGRLLIAGADGNHGWIWLRDGQVSGASGPGPRPLLANRLLSFGMMPRSRISKMIAEARSRPGVRLFDLLIEHDSVPTGFLQEFVTAATAEQVHHIRSMGVRDVRFENGQTQRAGPILVPAHVVMAAAAEQVTELTGIPPTTTFIAPEVGARLPDAISKALVSRSDGSRNARELANTCGLTLHETLTRIEALIISEALAIAPSGLDTEPWALQQPLPATSPEAGETAASLAEAGEQPTRAPVGAPAPTTAVAPSDGASADTPSEELPDHKVAPEAVESPSQPSAPPGFTPEDLARFTTGMASVHTPAGAPPAPTTHQAPAPETGAAYADTNAEASDTEAEFGVSKPANSAADRRDLMSNLSSLSQELSGGEAPEPPLEAAVEANAERDQDTDDEPETDRAKKKSGHKKKSANPSAASEMFRELRSLADSSPESFPPTEE